jgi:hypothetical protein
LKEIWPTNLWTLEGSVWLGQNAWIYCDLKGKIDKSYATYPPHYSKLGVSPLRHRYTASVTGRELLSHGVAAIILLLMIL